MRSGQLATRAARWAAPLLAALATGAAVAATGAAPPGNRCPLTAEQVSSAVGAKVKGPDSSCSFFPVDEAKAFPSAGYNRQSTMACTVSAAGDEMRKDMGYTEKLDGLGVPAHVGDRADGSWILVCRSNAPFEVRVDAPPSAEKARAAATALAKQILAAR